MTEIGVGVISRGMGDWGIEERAEGESFHGCRGIRGVSKGDERAVGETIGATAGIISDEDTTQLLTVRSFGGSSKEGSRFGSRTSRLEIISSWDPPSCECLRCSSRTKPMNKFLKTHLPIFTIVKKN